MSPAPGAMSKRPIAPDWARPLTGREGSLFASGDLMLKGEDRPLAPAELEMISEREARLSITEGRYHQVRRMFAAAGNHVEQLHRECVGGLSLPEDMAPVSGSC